MNGDIDWETVLANLDRLTTEALVQMRNLIDEILYGRLVNKCQK